MKHLIVGGVAGGATAAARIRRIAENDEIILFEKGEYISYANCGLPYYIGGTIADRSKLFVQTPEAFGRRFDIDVRTRSEVLSIHTEEKKVTVKAPDGSVYEESYDKLLLSPGASPVKPPLPGIDLEGIFTLRNVSDTDAIKQYIGSRDVKRAVVIGGGFIGLEMAENLHDAGAEVTVVEMADQVMAPIDFSMAAIVHQHLLEKGVRLRLNTAVTGFEKSGEGLEVAFASGEKAPADIVILSIGVRPLNTLATAAGLATGQRGGIKVNEYLRTSAPDIYAVGDVIEYPHPVDGNPWMNYLAGPANRQARIVADNMVQGDTEKYEGSIGTSIAKVFDLTVAATGMAAKRLKQENIPYLTATIHPNSHAGYYPGATPMSIKVVFAPETGRLLGAQIVGYYGVDKRIDELAFAIKRGCTVNDLTAIEHAYAPPYSSAKDPVALAGYVAGNILSGKMNPITWRELRDIDKSTITLIDVRTPVEFANGTIDGAINIPLDDMRRQLDRIPRDKPIVLFCGVGLRGYLASNILKQRGFKDVRNLSGGIKTYRAATAKIADAPSAPRCSAKPTEAPKAADVVRIDACGLSCPGPIMKLQQAVGDAADHSTIQITATDPGFVRDAEAWCRSTGNRFVGHDSAKGLHTVTIEKSSAGKPSCQASESRGKGKSFILFSDDLDKALATFVLANGAAATGEKVTIFFTFWGLNAIKKDRKPKVQKDIFGKMFSMMLPSGSRKLKLSKMNMGGAGSRMMRYIMKRKNIESLESLRDMAISNGVEFIACQMSMDVMGITKEELLDNVTIGGVATYMNRADDANLNLFI
ncbi:MAG: FAD-dependent oxidoreductase [Muribaculaceae bacterium]|nr:FAD-dependent oxidoreductase [Muribaculaceae bacterium]